MTDNPIPPERPIEEAEDPAAGHARTLAELIAGNTERQRAQTAAAFGYYPPNTRRQMTTQPDIPAQRAELEEALAAAQAEHREVQHQAREAHDRVAQLREQLDTRPTDEFAADGTVKPKSEASKLYAQLQTAENPRSHGHAASRMQPPR